MELVWNNVQDKVYVKKNPKNNLCSLERTPPLVWRGGRRKRFLLTYMCQRRKKMRLRVVIACLEVMGTELRATVGGVISELRLGHEGSCGLLSHRAWSCWRRAELASLWIVSVTLPAMALFQREISEPSPGKEKQSSTPTDGRETQTSPLSCTNENPEGLPQTWVSDLSRGS